MDGKEALRQMFLAFGVRDVDRFKIYVEFLAQCFPAKAVIMACRKATLESKYLPTVAELAQAIKSLMGDFDENKRTKTWGEAWGEINKDMYLYGCTGKHIDFSTDEIRLTVEYLGGIDVLATSPPENFNTLRAQTKKIYEDVCRRKQEKATNIVILGDGALMLETQTDAEKLLSEQKPIKEQV